jgi:hypothetical protein
MVSILTLVTDRWRLSVRADEAWGELYDLVTDPNETVNIWWNEAMAGVRATVCAQSLRKAVLFCKGHP